MRGRIVSIEQGATLNHAVDALCDGDERIRAAVALTMQQQRALLVGEKRRAREARERDPERTR